MDRDQLYEYLAAKARGESELERDEARAAREDARYGATVSALSRMGSMAGTLGGKRADDTMVPNFVKESGMGEAPKAGRAALYEQLAMKRRADMDEMGVKKQNAQTAADARKSAEESTNKYRNSMIGLKEKELTLRGNLARNQPERRPQLINDAGGTPFVVGSDGGLTPAQLPKNFKTKPETGNENRAASKVAENFEGDYAKKTQIGQMMDRELAEFDRILAAGDEDGAAKHGEGMLKALNAAFGADAVGVEESNRIGGFLKPMKAPWEPGSMLGRDFDKFRAQVEAKSSAIKGAAKDSLNRAKQAREGGMEGLRYEGPSMVDTKPTPQSGTAIAAPAPPPGKVRVIAPNGKPGFIPEAQLQEALQQGFKEAP